MVLGTVVFPQHAVFSSVNIGTESRKEDSPTCFILAVSQESLRRLTYLLGAEWFSKGNNTIRQLTNASLFLPPIVERGRL